MQRLIHRAGLVFLALVGLGGPPATAEDGEIWVTAQNSSELKILLGNGQVETVPLPAGSEPHTISFSPDGSYAYVSNLGNGDLLVVRADDRQVVAALDLGATFTHQTTPSPDGSVLLSANPMSGILTKIDADEETGSWTIAASLDMRQAIGRPPVCVAFRPDGGRAYVSLFGAAGGIAVVDVASLTVLRTLPTIGTVSGCGSATAHDGRTMYFVSAGGTGHFYRLDTATDTLVEDTGYGAIGLNLHGLVTSANGKRAYVTAVASEAVKVLDLNGTEVTTIPLDVRPGTPDFPDGIARKGSNIYVTLRLAGQVARIKAQTGEIDYIELVPPGAGYPVHGITVRP